MMMMMMMMLRYTGSIISSLSSWSSLTGVTCSQNDERLTHVIVKYREFSQLSQSG